MAEIKMTKEQAELFKVKHQNEICSQRVRNGFIYTLNEIYVINDEIDIEVMCTVQNLSKPELKPNTDFLIAYLRDYKEVKFIEGY